MPKVLIIENDNEQLAYYRRRLQDEVEILQAHDEQEALSLLAAHPDVAVITVTDSLQSGFDTEPVIRKLRQTFTGPMVGTSEDESIRKRLLTAECTYAEPPMEVAALVVFLLGL